MKIKSFEQEDFGGILEVFEECGSSLFTNLPLITKENLLDNLLRNDEGFSVLFCIHDGDLKGFFTLNNVNYSRNSALIGNIAVKQGSSPSLGLKASKWALNYCFETLNLNRVYGHTWSDNPKMDAFYQRLGAVHEGTEREHTWKNGQYVDMKVWGILRKEYNGCS